MRDLEGNPTRRARRLRHVVPRDPRVRAGRRPGRSTGSPRRRPGRLMVRQYEECRRSRLVVVLSLAQDDFADADEFEIAVAWPARSASGGPRRPRRRHRGRASRSPRVVRGACMHPQPARRLGARVLDGLAPSTARRRRCRSTTSAAHLAGERLSIAFVVVGSRVSLTRCSRRHRLSRRHGRRRGDLRRARPPAHTAARRHSRC